MNVVIGVRPEAPGLVTRFAGNLSIKSGIAQDPAPICCHDRFGPRELAKDVGELRPHFPDMPRALGRIRAARGPLMFVRGDGRSDDLHHLRGQDERQSRYS